MASATSTRSDRGRRRTGFVASMDKEFYVSPFIEMRGGYTVRVRDEPSRLRITINEDSRDGLLLHTSLDLARRPLTDRILLRMLVRHPLVTHKTIGADPLARAATVAARRPLPPPSGGRTDDRSPIAARAGGHATVAESRSSVRARAGAIAVAGGGADPGRAV